MAKTIKFNLICDGNPIRTMEDLQNNFSIEDVLAYYNNKLLHRWLNVRGYTEELEKINKIQAETPIEIIQELITVFNVANNPKEVEQSIQILEYKNKRRETIVEYESNDRYAEKVIKNYEEGYNSLFFKIIENPNNVSVIKASLDEMVNHYHWIFVLNHRTLFNSLLKKSNLAIMCLLMNPKSRDFYLPIMNQGGKQDLDDNPDKIVMYRSICHMIKNSDFEKTMGDNLHVFSGITDGYWKDLEPKGKKFMIISINSGDFVRSSGLIGGDLTYGDILNKFVIVDGIDYKSNSDTQKLLYMEV